MYYKTTPITLKEAVAQEAAKGFECKDEFYEVMRDIAYEYEVSTSEVLSIFYDMEAAY